MQIFNLNHYKSRFRSVGIILLALWTVLFPVIISAQSIECEYLNGKPSVEHARRTFRAAELECAERELRDLLAVEGTPRSVQAEAHMLLASVYYVGDDEPAVRRSKVKKELIDLFLADRDWQGRTEIQSAEFRKLLSDARDLAEWKYRTNPELLLAYEQAKHEADSLTADSISALNSDTKQKKWYTKWWAVGSGIGIIAMAAILMSGGNDASPALPADTLPPFPDTP